MEWMEKRHHEANHVLCIVSETYLKKPYSSLERQAGLWAAVTARPNFVLPVFIEPCEAPTLLAPFKRCDLHGLEEQEARVRLKSYLAPAAKCRTSSSSTMRTLARRMMAASAAEASGTSLRCCASTSLQRRTKAICHLSRAKGRCRL
jgi:hypothetical protein